MRENTYCPWCGRNMDKLENGKLDGHTWYRDDSDYIQNIERSRDFMKKRIEELEQLYKDQRYCMARKGNCRYCPLWDRDKEQQCHVLNPNRREELGLEDRLFDHVMALEQLCRDLYHEVLVLNKVPTVAENWKRDMNALGLLDDNNE